MCINDVVVFVRQLVLCDVFLLWDRIVVCCLRLSYRDVLLGMSCVIMSVYGLGLLCCQLHCKNQTAFLFARKWFERIVALVCVPYVGVLVAGVSGPRGNWACSEVSHPKRSRSSPT